MKIPLLPPDHSKLFKELSGERLNTILHLIMEKSVGVVANNGEYAHWDKLRHLTPPENLSPEEYWFAIKFARKNIFKVLPFNDKYDKPFLLATPDRVLQKLHFIDRKTSNPSPILNSDLRDSYLTRSLIEEAITSSQLEGASTTRKIAKEMLQTSRKPRTKSEQMIFNNYQAMQFIHDMQHEKMTPQIILELHRILTKDTLDDPLTAGKLRSDTDEIHVWDNSDGQILHTPPHANELEARLQKMCNFANAIKGEEEYFIHPIIRAILLHFMLAYDHFFVDGNGRTARALFYWSMAHMDYNLMEFISISQILKKSPRQYARAFLYTETDENDATYFILHQLDVIIDAIDELYVYLNNEARQLNETEQLLQSNKRLSQQLNYRQVAIIKHALRHSGTEYRIEVHRQTQNITYETARTDFLKLVDLGLLLKEKSGKAFAFTASPELRKKLLRHGT